MPKKLTPAQRRALEGYRDVRGNQYVTPAVTCKTSNWLYAHGFLELNVPGWREAYRITDAGREALENE